MTALADHMPIITPSLEALRDWDSSGWARLAATEARSNPTALTAKQSMDFGKVFDQAFGEALAAMLGGVPVRNITSPSLVPPEANCVEVGEARIIGGIRPRTLMPHTAQMVPGSL